MVGRGGGRSGSGCADWAFAAERDFEGGDDGAPGEQPAADLGLGLDGGDVEDGAALLAEEVGMRL